MAETTFSRDQFSCPICLDLLKDPVSLSCGHSYCMSCITGCFDQDEQKEVYSCPQCRQTFTPRPVLGKNVVLAEMLDKLVKLQTVVPAQCYAGPGEVECDVCIGRKCKAVKSCLVCLESYCQSHFERHEEFRSGKQHKITDATGRLQEMICHEHDKLLEIYCRTDQQCICLLCMMNEHKHHDTVTVAAQRTEDEKHLKERIKEQIQELEKEIEELRKAVKDHKCSAQTAVEQSERIFTELIGSIERSRSEVTQLIKDQEKAAESRAENFLKKLQQKIADLRGKEAELEQLSHLEDIQFLQSLSVLPVDSPNITVSSLLSFDNVQKSVSHLRKKLEEFCQEEIKMISGRVTYIQIIPVPEPKTREEFLRYRSRFTLDPNTVNKNLRLSEGNRMATYNIFQQYPDHPDRFDHYEQVLCRESVCGRCYWEVEWSRGVAISVAYKSISRKGKGEACLFGCNGQSWRLFCGLFSCSFWHNNRKSGLPLVSRPCKIGVYVDHSAGTLSFYSVSDKMTLIHREQTTFTQPLYPGFRVTEESSVKLCDL